MGYDTGLPRMPSDAEMMEVDQLFRLFSQLQSVRSTTAAHWEEVAELIRPASRNTFMFGSRNTPGEKKTERQVDSSGQMALSRFGAICDSLLTPRNMFWHGLAANDDYVMKDRATRLWFENSTRTIFKYRYSPLANFTSQNQNNYQELGAFGLMSMFIDKLDDKIRRTKGIRYKSLPVGETFFYENHQGIINGCIRWFQLTALQAEAMWPGMLPAVLQTALKANSQVKFNFLHHICERGDYDADRLDYRSMPYRSMYLSCEGRCLMFQAGAHFEDGYTSFPIAPGRYEQAPNETYGRGPAMLVLPALKTLNAQKRTFLKQGHRASDPVLLGADDGLLDFDMRPGAFNKGGMSMDGKRLVDVLPVGNIQINEKMMEMERTLINDAFLVTLFQVLTETPQMTATEVIERTNEKGILLAPTVGRQQSEYLGPMIDREIDVLSSQGLLAPMPPRLKEAKGEYQVIYTSPLSRAMRAQEAAGFMRLTEHLKELVNITQDPSLLDPLAFDRSTPAMAEIDGVPFSWMASEDEIAAKRKNRAKSQQQQAQIQAMPAQAAMMKAQAVAQKESGGQPAPGQQQGMPQ